MSSTDPLDDLLRVVRGVKKFREEILEHFGDDFSKPKDDEPTRRDLDLPIEPYERGPSSLDFPRHWKTVGEDDITGYVEDADGSRITTWNTDEERIVIQRLVHRHNEIVRQLGHILRGGA